MNRQTQSTAPPTSFLWLDITGKCQLTCKHCFAGSSPSGTHGTMTEDAWLDQIDQAADAGVVMVQIIGGEPMLQPLLPALVTHALERNMLVEVYSNLVFVPDSMWPLLQLSNASLATSFYSGSPEEHAAITGGTHSHRLTVRNIIKAVQRGIIPTVAITKVLSDQDIAGAMRLLRKCGVPDGSINYDELRQIGRGVHDSDVDPDSQLCGNCGDGSAAIMSDGNVTPCVFARHQPVGNVLEQPLEAILIGEQFAQRRAEIVDAVAARLPSRTCTPDRCHPDFVARATAGNIMSAQ